MGGYLDILIITESKLDESFPLNQFSIDGYYPPYCADRTANGGGIIIYIRDHIPCTPLKNPPFPKNLEGIFIDMNLRKSKWLLFGGYNPSKGNIENFLKGIDGAVLDHHMTKYNNFKLLDDYNSEVSENAMKEFCDTF